MTDVRASREVNGGNISIKLPNGSKMWKHRWNQLELILNSSEAIAELAHSKGGCIALEWPTDNFLWDIDRITAMLERLGLQKTNFNGCKVNLRSTRDKLICKPWTVAHNMPELLQALEP